MAVDNTTLLAAWALLGPVLGVYAREVLPKAILEKILPKNQTGDQESGKQSTAFWESKLTERVKAGVREELAMSVSPDLKAQTTLLTSIENYQKKANDSLVELVTLAKVNK